jgi:hypothetical protein
MFEGDVAGLREREREQRGREIRQGDNSNDSGVMDATPPRPRRVERYLSDV